MKTLLSVFKNIFNNIKRWLFNKDSTKGYIDTNPRDLMDFRFLRHKK